jgi:hypothetical protein
LPKLFCHRLLQIAQIIEILQETLSLQRREGQERALYLPQSQFLAAEPSHEAGKFSV